MKIFEIQKRTKLPIFKKGQNSQTFKQGKSLIWNNNDRGKLIIINKNSALFFEAMCDIHRPDLEPY